MFRSRGELTGAGSFYNRDFWLTAIAVISFFVAGAQATTYEMQYYADGADHFYSPPIELASGGTHIFFVNGVPWGTYNYVAYKDTGSGYAQIWSSNTSTGYDPSFNTYVSPGNKVKLVIYDGSWNVKSVYYWYIYQANRAPSQPGIISASNITQTNARVSWGASTDPDGDSITYYVEYKTDWALTWTSVGSTTNTYRNLSGLEADTVYDVRVRAYDSELYSSWRDQENVFTTLPYQPDLIAYNISVSDTTVEPGQSITVNWTAKNQGLASCGNSQQGIMWSTDSTISTSDILLEKEYLGSMSAGGTSPESHTITIPSNATRGSTYYIGIIADYDNDITNESSETNNDDGTPVAVIINLPPETISIPTSITGPSPVVANVMNQYTASGASSNLVHIVQYQFDWGDGSDLSIWTTDGKLYHSWPAGTYYLKARARCKDHTDKVSSWSGTLKTVISILPPIQIISPNGGESCQQGSTQNITWTHTANAGSSVKIELYKNDSYYSTITASTSNDDSYPWTIPLDLPIATDYQVKISSISNSSYYDYSDGYFYITAGPQPQVLSVIYPSSILEGDWADIDIEVKNTGGSSPEGGISLSIPSFTNSTDDQLIYNDGSSSGISEYYIDPEKANGSTIYDKNGNLITASYLLAEYVDNDWQSDEINYLRVKVKPKSIGNFTFYVRSAMQTTAGNWINMPSSSSSIDQQGWPVNMYTIQVNRAATITAFNPPMGTLQRGTQTQATVKVKNAGTTPRSFWIGLSFAEPGATLQGWPEGWYDILPKQTKTLALDEEETLVFEFEIPSWLPPGQYTAHTAVWNDYNRTINRMLEPEYDRRSFVESFELGVYEFPSGTLLSELLNMCRMVKTWSNLEGSIWEKYDANEKMLIFLSVGVGEVASVSGTMLIDATDLFGVTPEGQDDWVTVWIDPGISICLIDWSPIPITFGTTGHTFVDHLTADIRPSISTEIDLSFFGTGVTGIALRDSQFSYLEINKYFETEVSLCLSQDYGIIRYEIKREKMEELLRLAISGSPANFQDTTSLTITLFTLIKELIDTGNQGTDFRIPGTDDDGNWKPNTPINLWPEDGAINVSTGPILWGSPYFDKDGDWFRSARFQIDESSVFDSPVFDGENNFDDTIELPVGYLEYGTLYYWRTKYQDWRNTWSNWSIPTSFTTETGGNGILEVLPPTDLASDGEVGGPFIPQSKEYSISNAGETPIQWNITWSEGWIDVSPNTSGTLGTGESETITVSINSGADVLSSGMYSDIISFTNTTNHNGDTSREITLNIRPLSGNQKPTAQIDSITPNPASEPTQTVSFMGTGMDADGTVTAYRWESSIDGLLSTDKDFTMFLSELSIGTHTISYSVQDNDGAWSDPDTRIFIVEELQPPSKAIDPNPGNGLENQSINVDLSWSNGGGATNYDVYFGTNSSAVSAATHASSEFKGNQTNTSYDPGTLAYSATYYWCIDANNASGITNGDIWSFTTEQNPSVEVPNVIGMTQSEAETNITGAGLTVDTVTQEYSNTVAEGLVISQNPIGGTAVDIGSSVNLVISLGKPIVPNVVGMTQAEAAAAITSSDSLTIGTVTQQYSNTVAADFVISQDPIGGTEVNIGSSVDLFVSLGRPVAPDVTGMTQAAATAAITAVDNLIVGTIDQQYSDTVAEGLVISQNPIGGTAVNIGSSVNLILSLGKPIVPNVVGMTQANADASITAVDNLTVGTITQQYSETVAVGLVINQNPVGGTVVNIGSSIDLVISLGNVGPGTVSISAIDNQAAETILGEPFNTGTFRIIRTGNTVDALTVYFSRSGTAAFGSTRDYILSGNGLTATSAVIPAGQEYVDITVTPIDNLLREPNETVILTLKANAAYILTPTVSQRKATVTILDNEPVISIIALDNEAAETASGEPVNTGTFRISRTVNIANPITVYFRRSGNARFGSTRDYTLEVNGTPLTASSIVIPAGQEYVDIRVTPRDNLLRELNETVILTLRSNTYYNLTPVVSERIASVTILDNEPTISIASLDNEAAETAAGETENTGTFRVSRVGNDVNALTVYFTRGGTAAFGVTRDYTLSGNGLSATAVSVVIPAGQEYVDITLRPWNNLLHEATETVILTLRSNVRYNLTPTVSQRIATMTIIDNDP